MMLLCGIMAQKWSQNVFNMKVKEILRENLEQDALLNVTKMYNGLILVDFFNV